MLTPSSTSSISLPHYLSSSTTSTSSESETLTCRCLPAFFLALCADLESSDEETSSSSPLPLSESLVALLRLCRFHVTLFCLWLTLWLGMMEPWRYPFSNPSSSNSHGRGWSVLNFHVRRDNGGIFGNAFSHFVLIKNIKKFCSEVIDLSKFTSKAQGHQSLKLERLVFDWLNRFLVGLEIFKSAEDCRPDHGYSLCQPWWFAVLIGHGPVWSWSFSGPVTGLPNTTQIHAGRPPAPLSTDGIICSLALVPWMVIWASLVIVIVVLPCWAAWEQHTPD